MRLFLWGFLVIASGLTVLGCGDDSEHMVSIDSATEWVWVGEDFIHETTEHTFAWNSSLSGVVRVEVKGDPLTGFVNVRIYDANGAEVLDEDFEGNETDFRDTNFTHPAVPGPWFIKIDLEGVTGDLRVIIDDRL